MNNFGSDREREFFVTGVKTYLEVDDAMTEFRRLVQQKCRDVIAKRLPELNQVCGIDWNVNDLGDYSEKSSDYQYLGKKIDVKGLGGIYFCLRLSAEDEGSPYHAFVFLYRIRKDLAPVLWGRSKVDASVHWKGGNNIGFRQSVPADKVEVFEESLDQALTHFLAFIKESGGIRRHLTAVLAS